jgi:hypothetical protein
LFARGTSIAFIVVRPSFTFLDRLVIPLSTQL